MLSNIKLAMCKIILVFSFRLTVKPQTWLWKKAYIGRTVAGAVFKAVKNDHIHYIVRPKNTKQNNKQSDDVGAKQYSLRVAMFIHFV